MIAVIVAQAALAGTALSAAGPAANLDQCTNGQVKPLTLEPCVKNSSFTNWVNGNSNGSKSHWSEGEFISYRSTMTGLAAGLHTYIIQYDTVHGGKHALDYLGSFDATETTSTTSDAFHFNHNDPCSDKIPGCVPSAPTDSFSIPAPSLVNCATSAGTFAGPRVPGAFKIFGTGADLTAVSYPSQNVVSGTGQCATTASISFTVPSGTSTVVLAWGGHIASEADWGTGNSATNISGSPYHMAQVSLDGKAGSQDRSLSTTAVVFPTTITTSLSTSSISVGETAHDSATLAGNASNAGGTVDYRYYSSQADCQTAATAFTGNNASGGTDVGSRTVTNGVVPDSVDATFNTAGTFYWAAFYSGDTHNLPSVSGCGTEILTVGQASPTLTTTTSPPSGSIGDTLTDSATLSGSTTGAGGTIDFFLFAPGVTCDTTGTGAVYSSTAIAVSGDNTYLSSAGTQAGDNTASTAGTYTWVAVYSGDLNNTGTDSGCGNEDVAITSPPPVSQITPTATTCAQFKAGTAGTLSTVNYSVKGGKISQVSPGVFFYWVTVTAGPGMNVFTIDQTITTGNFSTYFTVASGSSAFTSTCTKVTTGISQISGTVSVAFNAGTGGTFIIGIKYSTGSVKGATAPSPSTVHYDFSTEGVASSTSGLDLVKK